jgi:hypothetical protein
MAIVLQNTQNYDNGVANQSSYSPTHNLLTGSGNDRLVIVTVNVEDDGTDNVSSVTFDGQAPDNSQQVTGGTGFSATTWMGIWFESSLPSTTGNKTVAVTMSGTINRNIIVKVQEYSGVSNSSVTQRFYTDSSAAAGSASTSVTVDNDDSLIVGSFTCGGATFGTASNLTQNQAAAHGDGSTASGIGSNLNSDTPSETVGWGSLSTRYAWVAAVFNEAIASSSSSSSSSSESSSSSTSSSSTFCNQAKLIAQDTNGTFDCNVTTWTDVPFNNLVQEDDDTVIEQTSTTQYTVKEDGKYLVLYNLVHRNDTYANRVEFLSRIEVNGTESAYGHAQGYRRDATNDRVFHQAAAILDLTANDILSIAVIRSSTNDPTTHLLEGSASDIQILRLDDTLDYFRARSTDTTDVDGSTEHQVTWNNEDEKDSAFTHAANSATITLDEGIYLVAYNIRANTGTTGTRKTITTKATLGGTDVPQSYGYSVYSWY